MNIDSLIRFRLRHAPAVVLGALPLAAATLLAAESQPLSVATDKAAGQIKVSYAGKPLLVYAHATNQIKPYVKELYTLAGENVLLDAPPDHIHHHALMYAITVNGINFWEEAVEPGYQRSAEPPNAAVGVGPEGAPQAVVAHTLYWVARTNVPRPDLVPAALLIENRTLILSVNPPAQEVALQWRSEFKVGPAANRVTLSGSDYHGLGVRFPRSWDRVAKHSNAAGAPYPTQGKRDVLEARWSAVAKTAHESAPMLAVFAHPANKGPARFFTMLEPFTYLSATQGLDRDRLEYAAGNIFSVTYLVTVYSSAKSSEHLSRRFQEWTQQTQ